MIGLNKRLPRRDVLKLIGASAALAACNGGSPESVGNSESVNKIEKVVSGEIPDIFAAGFWDKAGSLEDLQNEYGKEDAAILASCSVSLMTSSAEGNLYFGSGGLIKHNDEYYLSTVFHVVQGNIQENSAKESIHFTLPGLNNVYELDINELGVLEGGIDSSMDQNVFIPLDNKELVSKLNQLENSGDLIPLNLRSLDDSNQDYEKALFRFQNSVYDIVPTEIGNFTNQEHFEARVSSGASVVCGGTSGSPIIELSPEGRPLNTTFGNLTLRLGEDGADALGVFGECTNNVGFMPNNTRGLANGLTMVKTF